MATNLRQEVPMSRADLSRRAFPRLVDVPSRWQDNDQYGHMNNAAYFSLFDTAVNSYLMQTTALDTSKLDAIGVVAETSCRYLSEVRFPDRIQVGLRLERLGTRSVIYELAVFRNEQDDASAVGRFVHVYVDAQSRRPVPVPTAIRTALEPLHAPSVRTSSASAQP